jgi:hypothetical protein
LSNSEEARAIIADGAGVRVFISYSNEDRELVDRLATYLENNNRRLRVFYDASIEIGDEWARSIKSELDVADVFIVILTAHSVARHFVQLEIKEALKKDRSKTHILPIRHGFAGELPFDDWAAPLSKIQHASWKPGPWEYYDELFEALHQRISRLTAVAQAAVPSLFRTVIISARRPFLDRKAVRDALESLEATAGAAILILKGERYVGKSYIAHLVNYARDKSKGAFGVISPLATEHVGLDDLTKEIEKQALFDPRDPPLALTTRNRRTTEYFSWMVRGLRQTHKVWWLILDGFESGKVAPELMDLCRRIISELETSGYGDVLRLILMDSPELAEIAVEKTLSICLELQHRDIQEEDAVNYVRERCPVLPDDELKRKVHEKWQVHYPAEKPDLPSLSKELFELTKQINQEGRYAR